MTARVAVVGAGISGLAAARALIQAGHNVVVFEASDRSGGLLGSDEVDGFILDRAASSFVPATSGAVALASDLGVELLEASPKARNRWVYIDGEMQAVPTSARQLLTSSLLSWRGKFRVLAEPLQPNLPGADESIAEFCRRRLGSEVTRVLIAPFVTGVFGGDAELLSLRACFPSLAALEARGGLLRGAAATKVEAVFSRMHGAATAKRGHRILAPKGGVEALVRALGKELEATIEYGTSIASLEKAEQGLRLHAADGTHHDMDALVLATPAPVTASLVEPHHSDMAEALREIPYAPMVVVGLGFDAIPENAIDGSGFLVAKGESLRTLGVAFESSVWSGRAPHGGALLRCMMGGARDPEILDCSDEEIVEITRHDLDTTLQIDAVPSFSRVIRWPRAIPQYTIGHLKREERIAQGATEVGLVVAGNAIGGVSVNDCIANAERVVAKVAERLSLAVAALCIMTIALATTSACGGSNKGTGSTRDAGHSETPREPADAAFVAEPSLPADRGKVSIMARWLWPPAEYRRSPGRNSCGVARRPPLRVELMGGLSHAVVTTAAGEAPGEATLAIGACGLDPPLVVVGVGAALHVQNLGEKAHEVVVEEMDEKGGVRKRLGTFPMRVAGQHYSLSAERAGVLRLHLSADPKDFAYAVVASGAADLTSNRGMANLELPIGLHKLRVWHAPVSAGSGSVSRSLEVEIQAQLRTKQVVDMGP